MTVNKSKPYVIFAPHIDDELIGCWSLIKQGLVREVIYFFDMTPLRKMEARHIAKEYDFIVSFDPEFKEIEKSTVLLIPNIRDMHPHHKSVNRVIKTYYPDHKKKYYSIDMNYKTALLPDYEDKRNALLRFFPTQASLFNDAKYYLFESIHDSESTKFTKIHYKNVDVYININKYDRDQIHNIINTSTTIDEIEQQIICKFPHRDYKIEMGDEVIYSGNYKI